MNEELLKSISNMIGEKLKANQQETNLMINAVVDEMGKMESRIRKEMDERFSKVDAQLLSMQHDINACKLEKETMFTIEGENTYTGKNCKVGSQMKNIKELRS